VLVAQVVEAPFERLEMRIGFPVIVEADLVEIPQAAVDGKIAAPIIGIALEDNALAGVDRADDVGTRPQRRLERGFLERVGLDRMLCQHRHQSEDEW